MGLLKKLLSLISRKRDVAKDYTDCTSKQWYKVFKMIRDLDHYDDKSVYDAYVDFEKFGMPSYWMADLYAEIKRCRPVLAGHIARLGKTN